MRVAHLLPAPGIPVRGPTGASAHVRGLADALASQHDATLYAIKDSDHRGVFGDPTPAVITGLPYQWAPLRRWPEDREIRAARRMAERVLRDAWRGGPFELVVERHSLFSDAGWRVADRLGIPWALEVNAPLARERERFESLPHPAFARDWERRVLLAAPTVIAVSQWLARWLRAEVGCRNVHWIPNGVVPLKGSRARGRAVLGVGEDEPLVGFVGSFKPWHGVDRLTHIARASQARLVLVGQVPDALARDLPEDVVISGHMGPEQLAHVVAAMDVGLAPYPADAPPWFCPLKILDYRAQGTPVVATDIGDARVLTEDGGSVLPPDDTDALIDATRYWLGRRCPRRVHSWRSVARELVQAAVPSSG